MQTIIQKWNHRHEDESGFTLIELLVVIVIIGVLSAVVVFSVAGITDKGDESACAADKNTLTVAEEAFYANTPAGQDPVYASEADLEPGYIESESSKHNITLSADKKDFTVVGVGACA